MSTRQRIVDFLGLRRNMVALLTMVILVGMGEKMAERFLPIYLLALGGGVLSVGLLNRMDNLLSALYSFPGGYLSDKLGYKRALLVFNLVAMAGYALVILVPTWLAVILGAVLFISWTALSLPATMSMVSSVLPKHKRTMTMCQGTTAPPSATRSPCSTSCRPTCATCSSRTFWSASVSRFPTPFVIWAMKNVGISSVQFGLLTTVEMITAMLIYIPVAYLADKNTKKPFVVMTFVNFTVFRCSRWWPTPIRC